MSVCVCVCVKVCVFTRIYQVGTQQKDSYKAASHMTSFYVSQVLKMLNAMRGVFI